MWWWLYGPLHQTWCPNCQTEQNYHHGQLWAIQPMVNNNITNACATGQWNHPTWQDHDELVNYNHTSLGSPTKTLLQSIHHGHL